MKDFNIWNRQSVISLFNQSLQEEPIVAESISSDSVTIEGRQGQFKEVETIHEKYSQVPEILDEVCLAQFATYYTYTNKDKILKETEWKKNSSVQLGGLKQFISKSNNSNVNISIFQCKPFWMPI